MDATHTDGGPYEHLFVSKQRLKLYRGIALEERCLVFLRL